MNFGEKLYNLRSKQGVFQKELAAYLHISISAISSYENDVHFPDLKMLEKIAQFFHVSTDYLLGRTEYTSPIEDTGKELLEQYTVAEIINTIIELPPTRREDIVGYINLLKLSDNSQKSQQS